MKIGISTFEFSENLCKKYLIHEIKKYTVNLSTTNYNNLSAFINDRKEVSEEQCRFSVFHPNEICRIIAITAGENDI